MGLEGDKRVQLSLECRQRVCALADTLSVNHTYFIIQADGVLDIQCARVGDGQRPGARLCQDDSGAEVNERRG